MSQLKGVVNEFSKDISSVSVDIGRRGGAGEWNSEEGTGVGSSDIIPTIQQAFLRRFSIAGQLHSPATLQGKKKTPIIIRSES
jgi:hypothetical protein